VYKFLIVIEKADGNYSVYSPDLPGCVAIGETREEAERNMYQAIEMHLQPIPKPHASAQYVVIK